MSISGIFVLPCYQDTLLTGVKCMICDNYILQQGFIRVYDSMKGNTLFHLYDHTRINKLPFIIILGFQSYMSYQFAGSKGAIYAGVILEMFPQFLFVRPIDSKKFSDKCLNTPNMVENKTFIDMIFIDESAREYILDFINNTTYECVLCGGVYDCGLPTANIVASHMKNCVTQ